MTYILRTISADRTSHNGFKWPESGPVECPDWDAKPECGNGLHGFLWGEGDGFLANWSPDAIWLVVKVDEYVDLQGKVKFPRGDVVFSGSRLDATNEIIRLGAKGAVIGAAVTSGYSGSAQAGYHGSAQAGDYGTAQAGHGGTAQAGYSGTARAGDYGTAQAGDDGTAQAGDDGTAQAGDYGTAQAGDDGIIQVKFWDGSRCRIATGYVGENGIKANTPYRVVGGKLVEVTI